MSKIIVESDEYFRLKEKLNKLSDINKSLKEKYIQLQKKSVVDIGFSIEKYDKIKTENENLKKDITFHKQEMYKLKTENENLKKDIMFRKQETNKLENDKKKLIYDITLFKNENEKLKNNINDLTVKNKKLNSMIEEFENRKKTKNEINHSNQNLSKDIKKEFNMNDFNKEYEEFIKKLKENSQNETI